MRELVKHWNIKGQAVYRKLFAKRILEKRNIEIIDNVHKSIIYKKIYNTE